MGESAKNRATARRTARENDEEKKKWTLPSLPAFFHSLSPVRAFPHYPNAWNRLDDWERGSLAVETPVLAPLNFEQGVNPRAKINLGNTEQTN